MSDAYRENPVRFHCMREETNIGEKRVEGISGNGKENARD